MPQLGACERRSHVMVYFGGVLAAHQRDVRVARPLCDVAFV